MIVKLQKSHISVSSVHKYHKSCSEFIWPIYDLLQLYEEKLQKSYISISSLHKYRKSCSELVWPFYGLLQAVWGKTSKISYLREFSAQVSQIVFWVPFDRFTTYYNCMRKIFKNLLTLGVQCTSITNRVLSSFVRFRAYFQLYEVKLQEISYLREFSAQVSQIVFSTNFTILRLLTTVWGKTWKISYLCEFSAKV